MRAFVISPSDSGHSINDVTLSTGNFCLFNVSNYLPRWSRLPHFLSYRPSVSILPPNIFRR